MSQIDELRFDGQVAIVTGAGRGLGRAYAILLARRGASVMVNDLGVNTDGSDANDDRAGRVVAEIEADGGTAAPNRDTVATPEGGEAIVNAALEHFGRLDIVINNAGPKGGRAFGDLTEHDINLILHGHLYGAFNVTRPAWRHMQEQRYGRIVMVSSQALLGIPGTAPYASAKGGIIGLTNDLAAEAGDSGIRVNAVLPSAGTPGNNGMGNELFQKWFQAFVPEQVAPVVAFLAHQDCPWNGEKIIAGAGRVARLFLASTRGVYFENLTPEHVAASIAGITDESAYFVSNSAMDDLMMWQEFIPSPDPSVNMQWH